MFETGQTIAHFKIVRKLGEGGMGAVYLAEDQKLGRKVAIKVLLRNLFSDDESRARFDREARTAAQINNHHVMSIYEIGTVKPDGDSESINYIVMEYIPGQSLIGYIKQNKCDMNDILSLSEKIASGLSAAHKLNIVHRDIKPSNIIVNDDGDAKILDFGLAKLSDPVISEPGDESSTISQELTRAGKILGTVSYMSPEQARGEALDSRADVFSFGILLYRMATGELPFASETQVSTLAKILETKHEPPHLKRADIPQELERIIDKCLQKKPGDRYQDTRDLLVDLRSLRKQYDSGITDSISAVTNTTKISKTFAVSVKKPLIALAVVVALLWAYNNFTGGDSTRHSSQSVVAAENSLAILGFENKTGDDELNWLETGLPEILLTDLSQAHSIKLISLNRILDYLDEANNDSPSHENFISAAEKLGAITVLSGSFYKLGDKVRIDARLLETSSGRIIFAEKVVGDDPFLLVDSLTNKIAKSLNVDKLPGDDRSVSEFTSSSPEAYKLYLDGMESFKEESFEEAIEKFNEALEIDSTFALPYMRIGMANVFEGRQTAGMKYFELAKKYEHKLPLRERSIVDIYADIWLKMEYDNALIKMESFVQNYPDDKEGRAIYGILVDALTGDKDKALAQLDSALLIDPKYALAYQFYMQTAENHDDLDLAIEYAIRFLEIEPESYTAQSSLASYLLKQRKYSEARRRYLRIIEDFPDEGSPHQNVAKIYLIEHKFDSAKIYYDNYKRIDKDNPIKIISYYYWMGNLENWKGNLIKGLNYRHLALKEALTTKDSSSIFSAYTTAAAYYRRMGLTDSAIILLDSSYVWARPLQKISYPMGLLNTDPAQCERAIPLFDKESEEFKSRVPKELWGMIENKKRIFEAICQADTLAMITGYERMLDKSTISKQNSTNDMRRLAQLLITQGKYGKGKDLLVDIRESGFDLTDAYFYLVDTYYIARANEGLGDLPAAKDGYQEVLRFWNDADIQIEPIKDSKTRLAKLTG